MNLSKKFIDTITTIWGNQGILWLQELPNLISFFCNKWQLDSVTPVDNLSYNYVARAYSNYYKMPVVLKIGISSSDFVQEVKALEFYGGQGCVRLLAHDHQKEGMLMELIEPGTTLRSFFPQKDVQAVELACHVMKKLHTKAITQKLDFPTIDSWFSLFTTLKIPHKMKKHVATAHTLALELKSTAQPQHLLHGDLHYDNILLIASNTGIAIDPKGVIGETAYEVGAFICNPAELSQQTNISEILDRRLNQFSEILDIDRQRLVKACYIRIILSACWTVQDKGDWRNNIGFAELVYNSKNL